MHQKIQIIGYLGKDPEMRYTAQGQPVTNFSVATSKSWTDEKGQKHERTVWFRVNAWRRLAETCNQYLSKGRLVMVEGELSEPKPYQRQDGQWAASLEVAASNVLFLSRGGEQQQAPATRQAPSILDEEEIPF